jgi:hypothetical protein
MRMLVELVDDTASTDVKDLRAAAWMHPKPANPSQQKFNKQLYCKKVYTVSSAPP